MELKISNLRDAIALSEEWATHTVSLLNSGFKDSEDNPMLAVKNKELLLRCYYFDDITPTCAVYKYKPNLKFATAEQIQDILKFTASLKPADKLLVHCSAGISRSTAVAIGILCQHGLTPEEALKRVLSIRPRAYPNDHILGLFEEILNIDGLVEKTYGKIEKMTNDCLRKFLRQNNL